MSVNLNGDPTIAEHSVIEHRFEISKVFHCDGLLLCTNKGNTRIVVWNPCTGQTRWIQPSSNRDKTYTLVSYQDNNSGYKSYKILSYDGLAGELEIYEINSNSSWRILDVTPECHLIDYGVYLKGKTYWLACDGKKNLFDNFLVSFDYTTEIFERLRVPYNSYYDPMSLSVVREEKLLVLLQGIHIWRKEIWVRNKTDEWNKFVTLLDCPKPDMLATMASLRFLVDEEKKVVMYCETTNNKRMVYIAGEDNKVTQVDLGESALGSCEPLLLNYVPSLVRI